jgi:hypothetical protein
MSGYPLPTHFSSSTKASPYRFHNLTGSVKRGAPERIRDWKPSVARSFRAIHGAGLLNPPERWGRAADAVGRPARSARRWPGTFAVGKKGSRHPLVELLLNSVSAPQRPVRRGMSPRQSQHWWPTGERKQYSFGDRAAAWPSCSSCPQPAELRRRKRAGSKKMIGLCIERNVFAGFVVFMLMDRLNQAGLPLAKGRHTPDSRFLRFQTLVF